VWPWGEATRESFETAMETLPERWGTSGANVTYFIPSAGNDARLQDWWRRLMVESASPGTAIAFMRMAFEIDVRDIVASIRVPTLILHRQGDHVCHVENARYLAAKREKLGHTISKLHHQGARLEGDVPEDPE